VLSFGRSKDVNAALAFGQKWQGETDRPRSLNVSSAGVFDIFGGKILDETSFLHLSILRCRRLGEDGTTRQPARRHAAAVAAATRRDLKIIIIP
jgi:hypothetical protein